ncbi:MAG: hypothetical protein GY856_29320 [bacterium]|nr:hypothetical protein [bacterium]
MKRGDSLRDPLPESFASEEEAGEFWDTHSVADYEEYLEDSEVEVGIQRRHYEIEVDRECFLALTAYAHQAKEPVRSVASRILKEKLVCG